MAEWFKAPVGVGTIAVTAVFTATSMAAPHSLAFLEFVVHQAAALRDYFAVGSQKSAANSSDRCDWIRAHQIIFAGSLERAAPIASTLTQLTDALYENDLMIDTPPDIPITHPAEMRAGFDLRIGKSINLKGNARITPAGVVTVGLMTVGILLATAALVRAARR